MKLLLWSAISWVALLCLSVLGFNLHLRRMLVKNYGPGIGTALWKEWKM